MSNIRYQQIYQPPTETYYQQVIKNVDPEARLTYQQSMNIHAGYCHNQQFGCHSHRALLQPTYTVQPLYHHLLNIPNNFVTVTYVDMMTAEQTANWIWSFCVHQGWNDALVYAISFKKNNINGAMLGHLNHEILKFDVGMWNHIHRLVLMTVIRQLFPLTNHQMISKPTRLPDFSQTSIRYDHRQKALTSQKAGNTRINEDKPSTLQHLVLKRDGSLGMNLFSVLHKTTISVSTESGSHMEVSASNSPFSRISMPTLLAPSPDIMICHKLFKGQFLGTTEKGEVVSIKKSNCHKTIVDHRRGEFASPKH